MLSVSKPNIWRVWAASTYCVKETRRPQRFQRCLSSASESGRFRVNLASANEDGATQWRRIPRGGAAIRRHRNGPVLLYDDAATVDPIGQLSELEAGYVVAWPPFPRRILRGAPAQYIPIRRVLTAAVWLGLPALAASALPCGFYWLAAWRALLGAIAGLIMVQSIAFSTAAAPADKRPVAAGYVYAGVGLGVFSGLFAMDATTRNCLGLSTALGSLCRLGRAMGWAVADIRRRATTRRPKAYPRIGLGAAWLPPTSFFSRTCAHYLLGDFLYGMWARHRGRRLLERRRIVGISWSTRHSRDCRAHRHFTDAADLLYVARVWGHRPGVSRSGAGIMVLVRLLWRPARPRVHYGGACPKWGPPRICRV